MLDRRALTERWARCFKRAMCWCIFIDGTGTQKVTGAYPWATRNLDCTLGYTGEGPPRGPLNIGELESRAQSSVQDEGSYANRVTVATANVTAWNSFKDSGLLDHMNVDVWCIQEHKIASKAQMTKVRSWLRSNNMHSSFGLAKGGISAGAPILRAQGLNLVPSRQDQNPRLRIETLDIGGLNLSIASIYGDCEDEAATRALLNLALKAGPQVIGADWNASVSTVKAWAEEDAPGWTVAYPEEDTCFTGEGCGTSSKIDFFLINQAARDLLTGIKVHGHEEEQQMVAGAEVHVTPLRTHKVVTLTSKVKGQIWLEK